MPTKRPPSVDAYPELIAWLSDNARCLWQIPGKERAVECWAANGRAFLVVAHERGWNVYSAADTGKVDETFSDLERRLGMRPQDSVTLWSTGDAGSGASWSDTYFWSDRDAARDNAVDGGHDLLKVTLEVVQVEKEA